MNFELSEDRLNIREISLRNVEALSFFRKVPEEQQEAIIVKALEIGLFCLERGQSTQDLEFVKRQIESLMHKVEASVATVGSSAEKALIDKIGVGNGQVLAPVKALVDSSSSEVKARLESVRTLLSKDLDPNNSAGTLGVALARIGKLLDPQRVDSVQGALATAVAGVSDPNGALAATVRKTVEEAVKPLKDEVDAISKQLSGTQMVAEALSNTSLKGYSFEDEIAKTLAGWARHSNGRVEQVGDDNQPGDFLVEFFDEATGTTIRVVVEARDRQSGHGRQRISQDLGAKFRHRKAHAAVHVSRTHAGLAKEVGEWAEGDVELGPWVACLSDHLSLALRFVVVQLRIRAIREARPDIDTSAVYGQVSAIKTALGRIRTVKTKVKALRDTTGDIENEADTLRSEIAAALASIEGALKAEKKPALAEGPEELMARAVLGA